jgi:ribosome biogenesis GTPase
MSPLDFDRLRPIGLTPAVAQSVAALLASRADAAEPGTPMRVLEVHRETVQLDDGLDTFRARLLPRLRRELDEANDAIATGDWVLVFTDAFGERWVAERVPPVTHLVRRDGYGVRHTIVSNVDTALLVMGLDGDFNLRRIERYLALVESAGVWPVIVLTKADVCRDVETQVDALRARLPASIPHVAVNALDPAAAETLAPYLGAGQTIVLIGSSGAGKSTLANTLLGAGVQDTGPARAHDSRGRHTTTARTLFRLPAGACLIDTPGLRTLRPDIDADELTASFADIDALVGQCRFSDCRHESEPGCAVRDAVPRDRLDNYRKLLREVKRETMTVLERQRQLAEWKSRSKAMRAWLKAKR